MKPCQWFQWMGGRVCDECGKAPGRHMGLEWLAPGSGLFSSDSLKIEWAHYGPGREFDVPLLTLCMGPELLADLQNQEPPQFLTKRVTVEWQETLLYGHSEAEVDIADLMAAGVDPEDPRAVSEWLRASEDRWCDPYADSSTHHFKKHQGRVLTKVVVDGTEIEL